MFEFLKYCIRCLLMVISAAFGYNPEGVTWQNILVGILTLLTLSFVCFGFYCLVRFASMLISESKYCVSRRLVKAIRKGQYSSVKILVENYPECVNTYPSLFSKERNLKKNRDVLFPLTEACRSDDWGLVALLLDNGADPNCDDGFTPLGLVYREKRKNWQEIAQLLRKYGASSGNSIFI